MTTRIWPWLVCLVVGSLIGIFVAPYYVVHTDSLPLLLLALFVFFLIGFLYSARAFRRRDGEYIFPLALLFGAAGSFGTAVNLVLLVPGVPVLALGSLLTGVGAFIGFYAKGNG